MHFHLSSFVEKHNRYSNWEAVVESSAMDDDSLIQHKDVKKEKVAKIFRKLPRLLSAFFMFIYGKEGY